MSFAHTKSAGRLFHTDTILYEKGIKPNRFIGPGFDYMKFIRMAPKLIFRKLEKDAGIYVILVSDDFGRQY